MFTLFASPLIPKCLQLQPNLTLLSFYIQPAATITRCLLQCPVTPLLTCHLTLNRPNDTLSIPLSFICIFSGRCIFLYFSSALSLSTKLCAEHYEISGRGGVTGEIGWGAKCIPRSIKYYHTYMYTHISQIIINMQPYM